MTVRWLLDLDDDGDDHRPALGLLIEVTLKRVLDLSPEEIPVGHLTTLQIF